MTPHRIPLHPLTPASFAPYGTVIERPPHPGLPANRLTAAKYPAIAPLQAHYPDPTRAKPTVTLFACNVQTPRPLLSSEEPEQDSSARGVLPVPVLERHPYTTQMFVPLAPSRAGPEASFVVVVAPSLAPAESPARLHRPPLFTGSPSSSSAPATPPQTPPRSHKKPSLLRALAPRFPRPAPFPVDDSVPLPSQRRWRRGRRGAEPSPSPSPPPLVASSSTGTGSAMATGGPPDLSRAVAFVARGDGSQAVTYGVGTWHAPMIAVGPAAPGGEGEGRAVEFVVVQYASGVAEEDCEEVETGGLEVVVEGEQEEEEGGKGQGLGEGEEVRIRRFRAKL